MLDDVLDGAPMLLGHDALDGGQLVEDALRRRLLGIVDFNEIVKFDHVGAKGEGKGEGRRKVEGRGGKLNARCPFGCEC